MSTRLRSIVIAGLLAVVAFGTYTFRLSSQTLSGDEIALLSQAQDGRVRLFFQVSDERWLQPMAVYATRLAAYFSPADLAGRVSSAAIGTLNVALIFILAQRLFRSTPTAVGAALLLLVTPAHFVYARLGVDAIYSLPFVLLWLIGLTTYLEGRNVWAAAAAASALGLGVYSQASAPVTMGLLMAVTLAAIWRSGRRDARSLALPLAVFLAALAIAILWFASHPNQYPDTFGRWAVHAAHLRSPLDGMAAFANWNTLGTRLSLYWAFFDPSWLFLDGPPDADAPLRGAAPFLFATLIALVAGVSWQMRSRASTAAMLVVAAIVVAPLAASTFGRLRAIDDALVILPLMVVLAAGGVASWFDHEGRWWRPLAWGVIVSMVLDSGFFFASYWPA